MYNTSYSHELVFNSVLDCENIEEIPPLNFIKIYDQGYLDIVNFFTNPLSNFLFSLFTKFFGG